MYPPDLWLAQTLSADRARRLSPTKPADVQTRHNRRRRPFPRHRTDGR
jgi:hypothetical protein